MPTADDKPPAVRSRLTVRTVTGFFTPVTCTKQYEAKDCTAARNEDADSADPTKPMVACSTDRSGEVHSGSCGAER